MFSNLNFGSMDPSSIFTIIPFSTPREDSPQGYGEGQVVTDMWVERCIAANSAFNAEELVMCTPMPGPFPRPCMISSVRELLITDLKDVAISITGFSGADLLHIERLIELLGAQFYNNLTRKRSLLLCPDQSITGPKTIKAKEWGIPIVNVGWLWEVISKGDEEVDISTWCDNPFGKPLVHHSNFRARQV